MIDSDSTEKKIVCVKCDREMIVKIGKYGKFLSCSGYPDCKTTKAILKKTGAKCPSCGVGDIVEKKTKSGRNFFACSRYPECEHAMWQKPTGEKCPKCSELLVFAKAGMIACSSKECKFTKEGPAE